MLLTGREGSAPGVGCTDRYKIETATKPVAHSSRTLAEMSWTAGALHIRTRSGCAIDPVLPMTGDLIKRAFPDVCPFRSTITQLEEYDAVTQHLECEPRKKKHLIELHASAERVFLHFLASSS